MITPDRQHFAVGDYIASPPLIAIEIRSPDDESYEKLPFYADIGIPEVWIIDRHSTTSEVFLLHEGSYSSVAADEQA